MQTARNTRRSARPGVVRRAEHVLSLSAEENRPSADALYRHLKDRSPRVRAFALDVVRKLKLRELNKRVLELLSDSSRHVQYAAAECVGTLHEGEHLRATWLYPLLNDPALLVRIEAIESLVQIEDRSSLRLVVERISDSDALVRSYAAWALAELKGKKYIPALRRALGSEKEDRARLGFLQALFNFGDSAEFPVILEFLASPDYRVRCACANGLATAELTAVQLKSARDAVAYALDHALFRADKTTMESVLEELQTRV